jgi:hypothetical protein
MALMMTDLVVLHLHCPMCGNTTAKALSWLLEENELMCRTNGCTGIIKLDDDDYGPRIKKFADLCAALDPPTIQKIDPPKHASG